MQGNSVKLDIQKSVRSNNGNGSSSNSNKRIHSNVVNPSLNPLHHQQTQYGQASSRMESLGMKGLVKLSAMDVEHLEYPSKMFDTVVDTFSLCVFSDPVRKTHLA